MASSFLPPRIGSLKWKGLPGKDGVVRDPRILPLLNWETFLAGPAVLHRNCMTSHLLDEETEAQEVKGLGQGHLAHSCQNQGSSPRFLGSGSAHLPLHCRFPFCYYSVTRSCPTATPQTAAHRGSLSLTLSITGSIRGPTCWSTIKRVKKKVLWVEHPWLSSG